MTIENPILLDLPMPIQTERVTMRPVMPGDGKYIFAAIDESRESLAKWLPWPKHVKSWQDSEKFAREHYAEFFLRKSMVLGLFREDHFIGLCGFNGFDWSIPSADIGYWCRISEHNKGHMTEAVHALTKYGFETIGLKRITINCMDDNRASIAIPEKLGFDLEVRARGLLPSLAGTDLVMSRRYVRYDAAGL